MVVKKKGTVVEQESDTIDLSRNLQQVRDKISTLPTDDGATMTEETKANESTSTKKAPKKKAAKKSAGGVKKKAVVKTDNLFTLKELGKELKLEPRACRRILRNAKIKNPGRWAWEKNSAELAKARKALKDSQAE